MRTKEPFDYARGLMLNQRPRCPACTEMMVVQRRGTFLWACVRAGRCRGILPLDQEKFRAWAERQGVLLAPMPQAPKKERRLNAVPSCPKCDSAMKVRHNKKDDSRFWGCIKFPKCGGALPRLGGT